MMIRKLATQDAAMLQDCRLFALRESPESFLVTLAEVADTPLAQVQAELADDDIHYLGAFEGEALVGFLRYVRCQRAARRHVAEVRSVYVRQSVRGRGIGKQLLRRLVDDAKSAGIESLVLSVLEDNMAARRLYDCCGFQLHGTEPRAIRKGERLIGQSLYSRQV